MAHSCSAIIEHRSWPNVVFHIVHYPAKPVGRRLAQLTSSDWSVLGQCWSSVLLVNFVEPTKNNITLERCINLMLVQWGFVHRFLLSPITLAKLTKHCSGQCPTLENTNHMLSHFFKCLWSKTVVVSGLYNFRGIPLFYKQL